MTITLGTVFKLAISLVIIAVCFNAFTNIGSSVTATTSSMSAHHAQIEAATNY